jgi:hypothetical protein
MASGDWVASGRIGNLSRRRAQYPWAVTTRRGPRRIVRPIVASSSLRVRLHVGAMRARGTHVHTTRKRDHATSFGTIPSPWCSFDLVSRDIHLHVKSV